MAHLRLSPSLPFPSMRVPFKNRSNGNLQRLRRRPMKIRRSTVASIVTLAITIVQNQRCLTEATGEATTKNAAAFTPLFNRSSKTRRAPLPISDELGTSPTFRYRLFDPLALASEDNFAQFREAELKHGRIAMLAVVGNIFPEVLRRDGWSVLLPSPRSPAPALLSVSRDLAFRDVPGGLGALRVVPWVGWLQIIVAVGLLETMVLVQRDRRDMPGDYGVGYFGLRDKALHERSLQSELENGRLAMLAFLAQILIELVTGQTPGDQIRSIIAAF